MILPLLLLLVHTTTAASSDKPHILYVVMDDQGYGDVGYSFPETADMHTPIIDRYAKEGLILDRHYTAWMCTPTRASLMTGRYPISLGIQHDVFQPNTEECLSESELLLPEVIRHNGYATHMVGKWHLGYARWSCMPCMRGFDSAYGYVSGEIGYLTHELGGYYDFYTCSYNDKDGLEYDILTQHKWEYSMELYNKRVATILENHDPSTPLFLYLPLQTVHSNYWAPDKYYSCKTGPRCVMQAMLNAGQFVLNSTIAQFKARGLWENTLMVYHADNGAPSSTYTSNGPLRGYKTQLWEGGVRTLSFLYSENPAILSRRGSTDCYVHVSDWYNTLVAVSGGWAEYSAATGLEKPADLDSVDQSGYLMEGRTGTCPRTEMMLHIDPVKQVAGYLKGDYKILFGDQDSSESCSTTTFYPLDAGSVNWDRIHLFNIKLDPFETTNIEAEYPEVVEELKADIKEYLSHQRPLQCQLPTLDGSYPSSAVPFYLPFDYSHDTLPASAYAYSV